MMEKFTVDLSELRLDPDNSRKHNEANLAAIRASLERFGQVLPLVVHEGVVIGGNGTLAAMNQLGFSMADVVYFKGSRAEARALAVALNRTAELAVWDMEKLGNDLLEAAGAGFEPEILGFNAADLESMFPVEEAAFRVPQQDIEITANEEPEERPVAQPIIQYNLIFDDEEQQRRFFGLLRILKQRWPDKITNAARLDQFLSDNYPDE